MRDLKDAKLRMLFATLAAVFAGISLRDIGSGSGVYCILAVFSYGIAICKADRTSPFLTSAIYGFGSWLFSAYWLSSGINAMNQSYWWAGYLAITALAIWSTIPFLLFAAIYTRVVTTTTPLFQPFLASALLTLLVEQWPSYFPGTVALGLSAQTNLIQLLDVGGTPLLHCLLYSIGFSLAQLADVSLPIINRVRTPLISASLIIAALYYGDSQQKLWHSTINRTTPISVALVQPNIPIPGALNSGTAGSLKSLIAETARLMDMLPAPDFAVWPEIPLFFSPRNRPGDMILIEKLLGERGIPLLVNADMYENETIAGRVPFYNTVQLFKGSGQILEEYHKRHLVPFGEYLPFEEYLTGPESRKFLADLRRYSAGNETVLLHPIDNLRVGTPVCLEVLYSNYVASMIRLGANMLVVPANDGYFADSAAAQLDFAFAVVRAIEYRVPIVRVTNTGISAVINQAGDILPESLMPQFTPASRVVSVAPSTPTDALFSPYDRGLLILALFSLLLMGARILIRD